MKKHREGWGCVYSALNVLEDKEYIGKDKSGDPVNHRWNGHAKLAAAAKPLYYFHRGIKKAGGPEKFKWTVIWRGPLEEMATKEVYYIAKRHTWVGDPLCRGYNLTQGGDGSLGYKHSKRAKKAMSAAQLQRFTNKEEIEKVRLAHLGAVHSVTHITKMIDSCRRYYAKHPEAAEARRNQLRNVAPTTCSEVTRAKLIASHLGKPWSVKHRAAYERRSPEEKSASARAGWLNKSLEERAQARENKHQSWMLLSAEERSAIGYKSWITRRANALKKAA